MNCLFNVYIYVFRIIWASSRVVVFSEALSVISIMLGVICDTCFAFRITFSLLSLEYFMILLLLIWDISVWKNEQHPRLSIDWMWTAIDFGVRKMKSNSILGKNQNACKYFASSWCQNVGGPFLATLKYR